jgi:hypothetical protein
VAEAARRAIAQINEEIGLEHGDTQTNEREINRAEEDN